MSTTIDEIRVSLIWVERLPALLASNSNAPMAFLGNRKEYQKEFDRVLAGNSKWGAPWPPSYGRRYLYFFWYYYFGAQMPEDIESQKAWEFLVPLRTSFDAKHVWVGKAKESSSSNQLSLVHRANLEGFFYPHCSALAITLFFKAEQLPLKDFVNKVIDAYSGRYKWRPDEEGNGTPLNALALQLLTRLREAALGPSTKPGVISKKPFTVVTFIRSNGAQTTLDDELHRALEGLCGWNPLWEKTQPHDLKSCTIQIRRSPANHILYRLDRGRAVWFPESFASEETVRSLGCYHRNLTLLSMQTESLVSMIQIAADCLARKKGLSSDILDLAQYALENLEQLYKADSNTYKSWSPLSQIHDNKYLKEINAVRRFFGNLNSLEKEQDNPETMQ